jgi:hypothetical protein
MKGLMRLTMFVLTAWPASPVYSQDELKARCERTRDGGARTSLTDIASTSWPGRCPEGL